MSMTGFGKTEALWKDKRILIELRSLNSKTADINLRTPSYLREMDTEIRKQLIQRLYRGKIDVNIFIEFNGENAPTTLNKGIVKGYMEQLRSFDVADEKDLLALALRLPDTLSSEKEVLEDDDKKAVKEVLEVALKDLEKHRIDEGQELEKDFLLRLAIIAQLLDAVREVDPERSAKIADKLRTALDDLKVEVDSNRFEQELIFYLEKFDITEEKVRLHNHLEYFIK